MKSILITGSNGYIATEFVKQFAGKYNFILLSHKTTPEHITWDELNKNQSLIQSINIVLNLAGCNIGDKRWSVKRKREILSSRIETTQKIVNLFNVRDKKPHLISASAIGIYNSNQINDEETKIDYSHYGNFSEEITKCWESEANQYLGPRTITRFGVVFSGDGGAFPKMLKPFTLGLGGILGDGSQYMPWVALLDLLNALDFLMTYEKQGVYNIVAPAMKNNAELIKLIAKTWHKTSFMTMPKFLIKILFGQMGEELFLNSIKVSPQRLINDKFNFHYPDLESALTAIKNKML
ncbi:MAG: TIGR01777 family oxidoreductase [Burkholderiales bacterium]|nr:TIGR01777 family oxidoreductase [Burkholderiales bacterium]